MKKQLFLTLALLVSASSMNVHAADGGWDEISLGLFKAAGVAGILAWGNNIRNRENAETKVSGLETYLYLTSAGLSAASFTNRAENMIRVGVASSIFGASYFLTNRPIFVATLRNIPVLNSMFTSPIAKNTSSSFDDLVDEAKEYHGVGASARGIAGYMAIRTAAVVATDGKALDYML